MELEEGMYVRSKNQGIFIIAHINTTFEDSDFRKVCLCQNEKVVFANVDTIKELKASHKLMDIIEIGDYINGYKVIHKGFDDNRDSRLFIDWNETENSRGGNYIPLEDIKSIVTKEQFENMSYKVGETNG